MAAHFRPELFTFLAQLRLNNERDWFEANKARYREQVLGPFQQFVADLGPKLKKAVPGFVADPKPVGGSLMRIYRDIRFSKDKTPYKTGMSARFWYGKAGPDGVAPVFYLHLEPNDNLAGGGLWRPPAGPLAAVRKRLAAQPKAWQRAISGPFAKRFELGGESLKKVPRGFAADHPLVEDLKRKDFVATTALSSTQVCAPGFLEAYVRTCAEMGPFMRFLIDATA